MSFLPMCRESVKPYPTRIAAFGHLANTRIDARSFVRSTTKLVAVVFAFLMVAVGQSRCDGSEAGETSRRWLMSHCSDCHSGDDPSGGFDVSALRLDLDDPKSAYQWARIFDRVRLGEMPPQTGEPIDDIDDKERDAFLQQTSQWITNTQRQEHQSLGRVRGRRLTNLQLQRTLNDLLGIDLPLASEMAAEPTTGEFTTIADQQSMSHFQLKQHLKIVDMAVDEAFRRALSDDDDAWKKEFSPKDIARKNRRSREPEYIDGKAVVWTGKTVFYGRMSATRATTSGWYQVTLQASALKKPKDRGVWCSIRAGECTGAAPLLSWVGAFEAVETPTQFTFDCWLPAGHMFEIRPNDRTLKIGKLPGAGIPNGVGGRQNIPGVAIDWLTMQRIHKSNDHKQIRRHLFPQLTFSKVQTLKVQTLKDQTSKAQTSTGESTDSFRNAISSVSPNADLERLLVEFAQRAYRRPTDRSKIQNYIEFATQKWEETHDFALALKTGFRSILCSPRFLYLQEKPGELDDYEVASRLSYFLWNRMPDQSLMELAERGDLRQPEVLDEQVDRMLHHPHGKDFVVDFAAEWLELNQIDFTEPDPVFYPDFDLVVQDSMLSETHLFLEHLLHHDVSVKAFVDADFTFVNSRLARYYALESLNSSEMQKVALASDSRRGGLLSQGAILKVTANGTHTSPVLRGLWVCRNILGTQVPPPPENVPAIEPDVRGATTVRELLERHRSDSECASCHRHIDPPGFALENFDAAGRWRSQYPMLDNDRVLPGIKVDPSGILPSGQSFNGFQDFKKLTAENPEVIAKNFAEKLLAYGTGKEICFSDREAINQIIEETRSNGFGTRSIVQAVVRSRVFQSK